jgi:hypothetical protein
LNFTIESQLIQPLQEWTGVQIVNDSNPNLIQFV